MIRQVDGELAFPSSAATLDVGVPQTVRRMIEARMEPLRDDERRALEAASAVGKLFTAHDVAKTCDEDPEELENLYDELARRRRFIRFAPVRGSLSRSTRSAS